MSSTSSHDFLQIALSNSHAFSPLFARMIHNYLRWRLVLTYIDDLSLDYVHTYRTFLSAYYGYFLHATNEVYCSREIIRRFPLAIHRLHTMNSTTQPEAIQTVGELLERFVTQSLSRSGSSDV